MVVEVTAQAGQRVVMHLRIGFNPKVSRDVENDTHARHVYGNGAGSHVLDVKSTLVYRKRQCLSVGGIRHRNDTAADFSFDDFAAAGP